MATGIRQTLAALFCYAVIYGIAQPGNAPAQKAVKVEGGIQSADGKPMPIEPKLDPKTGFVAGGKNQTALIEKLTQINGIAIADLEKNMRPKALSKAGFLGADEKLLPVLAADNALVVDQLGLTHQELAWHLRVLAAVGNAEAFPYHGRKFKITVNLAKNFIDSPFGDGTRTNSDVKLHNLDNGKKLQFSLLVPLMIERYGFYEGQDTPYRVDPLQVLEVLDFLKKPGLEYRDLFTGKDLDGWVVDGPAKDKQGLDIWTVRDGMIHCLGKAFGFLRYDRQQFGDFAFRVEYRFAMPPPNAKPNQKGNSGIGIRTGVFDPAKSEQTRPSWAAFEVQLLDDAGLKPTKEGSGSLYRYLAPTVNPVKAAPQWNAVEIECVGPRIKVIINGQKIVDADQGDLADVTKGRPATAKAPKDKPLRGFICLQSHTGQVEFRKVQVREIPGKLEPPGKQQ